MFLGDTQSPAPFACIVHNAGMGLKLQETLERSQENKPGTELYLAKALEVECSSLHLRNIQVVARILL
jgi:hypothetical protein